MKNIIFAIFFVVCFKMTAQQPLPYFNTQLSFNERVDDLVSRMTLEEKVMQMVHNAPAIDRLGIPAYDWWNECLHGVARAGIATVFPQAIGMAAMWDTAQMHRNAIAISDEARAKYNAFTARNKRQRYMGLTYWTPNINIFRDPRWGRGMETYGEDPYLTGELAVPFIHGLQGDDSTYFKLIATAKHFVVHSGPEADRHRFDALTTQRDFMETYTPQFKKAIQQGHVYSVMCAYNRYQGLPCCGNPALDSLLRVDWGFNGYIVSDCWAIADFFEKDHHETDATPEAAAVRALRAGTDLNCGSTYPALISAVKQGLVSETEIDVSVKRLMLARMKLGMFDPQEKVKYAQIPYAVVDCPEHQQLALVTAEKSMVLLKNEKQTLPFSKKVKKVAVIGPNANNLEVLLGNYNGYPSHPVTVLEGIRKKLPQADVKYALGCRLADEMPNLPPVDAACLYTDSTLHEHGLRSSYFNNILFDGDPMHTRIEQIINHLWWTIAPFPDLDYDNFAFRTEGILVAPSTGTYALGAEAARGFKLFLNDSLILDRQSQNKEYVSVSLQQGKTYKIRFEAKMENSEHACASLLWDMPNPNLMNEAIALAQQSDVIVLCMGLSPLLEGEEMDVPVKGFSGGDRTDIELPASQQQLIKAIASLKKPTVLVLLNGSALAINWEAENMPAILEAWYPGQAGGTAIANTLWGDNNPAGRLPITFYRSIKDLPGFSDYNMEGRTYRYFRGKTLYEFGHGLSYNSFTYSNLKISQNKANQSVIASADIYNNGIFDGDEVVQLYVAHPQAPMEAIRTLQGFNRIHLKAGEKKTVTFILTPEQLMELDANNCKVWPKSKIKLSVGGCQPSQEAIKNRHVCERNITVR